MKAVMFPGQGSQYIGMGRDVLKKYKQYVEEASDILGYSLKRICLNEPQLLNLTEYTQPALFAVNALSYMDRLEQDDYSMPEYYLGHSLGEYNALCAAGAISFSQGIKIVKTRGKLMADSPSGAMAAVLGCDANTIRKVLSDAELTDIDIANYNSKTQTVISGAIDKMQEAEKQFIDIATFIPLNTSGAFHSSLMWQSAEHFRETLKYQKFTPLQSVVISNLSATPYDDQTLVNNLSMQMCSSVKWLDSILYLNKAGVTQFEEIGPGSVLTKLVSEILDMTNDSKNNTGNISDTSKENSSKIEIKLASNRPGVYERVQEWNTKIKIGDTVKFLKNDMELETRSQAMVLFEKKAVVYLKGLKGYFELDDLSI